MTRSQLPRGYVRFYSNGGSKLLRLPQETAKLVSVDQLWKIEATDDGIVLRAVDGVEQQLPAWASPSTSTPDPDPDDEIA